MSNETTPHGLEFADRLEALLELPLGCAADVEPWDVAAAEVQTWMEEHDLPFEQPHFLHHFFIDSDIRARDPGYRKDQEGAVIILIRQLRSDQAPLQVIADQIIPVLGPCLARLREAAEGNAAWRVENCGVIRKGPLFFTAGISFEMLTGPDTSVSLAFACIGISSPGAEQAYFRLNVAWHRRHVPSKRCISITYEANAGHFKHTEESNIRKLSNSLPRMEKAFLDAMKRGRPPSLWASMWGSLLRRCRMPVVLR